MMIKTSIPDFFIRKAEKNDAGLVLEFIKDLAEYEKLDHTVTATIRDIEKNVFSETPSAQVIFGIYRGEAVCFALYFYNFSTFLGKPGIYLEDLFVLESMRGRGYGKEILRYLARYAVDNGYGRFEWTVLDWNTPSIEFYVSLGAEIKKEWLLNRVSGDALIKLAESFAPTE